MSHSNMITVNQYFKVIKHNHYLVKTMITKFVDMIDNRSICRLLINFFFINTVFIMV